MKYQVSRILFILSAEGTLGSCVYTCFCQLALCGWKVNGHFLNTAVSTVPA